MVPHMVYFGDIDHNTKAIYKCTILWCVKSCKWSYINIAKTGIASLYFQCYNTISYLGHPRGSEKYKAVVQLFKGK